MKLTDRNDYIKLFEKAALKAGECFDESGRYRGLGFEYDFGADRAERMKGFSLPLWGFAPYFAGHREDKRREYYAEEIKNGTNPFCPDYWGEIAGCEEKVFSMAALAFVLLEDGEFFGSFGEREKRNLADWLAAVNDCRLTDLRHILCRLIVNIGLKNADMQYSDNAIEEAAAALAEGYAGDGMYFDAKSGSYDFAYCASVHFFALIYAKYIEKAYPERSERIKNRAKEFARLLAAATDGDGSGTVYGRETGKRGYGLGFWAALLYADASPFEPGELKGIINREIRMWTALPVRGSAAGFKYPNAKFAPETAYDGFEVFTFFVLTALPEQHAFFAAEEAEYVQREAVLTAENANMIITSSKSNSVVYPGGITSYAEPERYSKFAYSSKFGYCLPVSQRSLEMQAPDSMLCFEVNGFVCVNCGTKSVEILPDKRILTVWSPCEGIEVETVITPFENSHKREHTIRAAFSCRAYDCGYAVDVFGKTAAIEKGTASSEVMTIAGGCRIYSEYGEGTVIDAAKNTNTVSPEVKIPALEYNIPIGESKITSVVYEL